MRRCTWFALLLCFFSGCGDGNRVIDTTDRPPPPDPKEIEEINAAMGAAAIEANKKQQAQAENQER